MIIALMSCGMYSKNALNPSCSDSTIYFLLSSVLPTLCVRSTPTDAGPACPAQSSTDEREEQRQDARDRKYRAQALLRDILCGFASRTGQRYTRKLVDEARAHRRSYDGQDDRDNQR